MAAENSAPTSSKSIQTNYARLGLTAQTELQKLLQKLATYELARLEAKLTTGFGNEWREEAKILSKEPLTILLENRVSKNSHLYRLLTPAERDLISKDTTEDEDFDLHLLYKILRFLNLLMEPSRRWGSNIPPIWKEHTIGDDVERIRCIWNDIVYRGNTEVSDDELDQYFDVFRDIAIRFASYYDKPCSKFRKMFEDAKERVIDDELEKKIIIEMKELADRETQYGSIDRHIFVPPYKGDEAMQEFCRKSLLKTACSDYSGIKNIPEDVQDYFDEQIQKWKADDKLYVRTGASHHVIDAVKENNCVTITGHAGSGKTFLARHAALKLLEEYASYTIIPVGKVTDLKDYYSPGKPILFVIDDIGGKFAANSQQIEKWQQILHVIETIVLDDACKVIATCRSNIYNDEKFEVLSPFKSFEMNISAERFNFYDSEKLMFINIFELTNIDVESLPEKCDFFPLLFTLCKSHENDGKVFGNPIEVFCRDPWSVMKNELDNMFRRGTEEEFKLKICCLLLCVLLNNKVKETWFNQSSKITSYQRQTLEAAFRCCGLDIDMPKSDVKETLEKLEGTFVMKEYGEYGIMHNKVFDFLTHYFGQSKGKCLIENGNWHLLHERFIWQQTQSNPGNSIEFMIQVPDDFKCQYLAATASSGGLIIGNNSMKDPVFRQNVMIPFLDSMSPSERVSLAKEKNASGTSLLVLACQNAYPEIVQWLLNYGAPVDLCRWDGNSPLHFAAQIGNLEILTSLLDKDPCINVQNNKYETPLFLASVNGHVEVVTKLLEKDANVKVCEFEGETPLSIACYKQNTEIALILLKHDIDVNDSIITGDTALHTVCSNNNETLISALLEKNPDMTLLNSEGQIPLTILVENGTPDFVAMLLKNDFDVDTASRSSDSALIEAYRLRQDVENGQTMKIRMLLEKGANVNQKSTFGKTPLHFATQNDYLDGVKLIVEAGCDVSVCDERGNSPLCAACENGNTEIVKILLEKKADVNLYDNESPLTIASQRGHSDIVKMLLEVDGDIEGIDEDGCTPLILACQASNSEIIDELLERGADPNQRDNEGTSPLFWACYEGELAIGQKLLEKGANVNLGDNVGLTPLHAACQKNHTNLVQLLIDHKADVDVVMYDGDRPVLSAAWSGSHETLDLLLTNGADANIFMKSKNAIKSALRSQGSKSMSSIQNGWYEDIMEKCPTSLGLYMKDKSAEFLFEVISGSSPMHIASFIGHSEVVKCLTDHNVDVNVVKKDGTTPLIYACEVGHEDIVKLLLEKGANTELKRSKGNSKKPIDIAKINGMDAIVELLERNL